MILILGVTASGKGRLAFEIAKKTGGEIISIDSMKVYRRMDIGTGKPSFQRRQEVKYHLIDVVEPGESFAVNTFLDMTEQAIEQIKSRGNPVIAAGGTALYIKALLYGLFEGPGTNKEIRDQLKQQVQAEGLLKLHSKLAKLDPSAAARIHPNDQKRIIRALEVYHLTGKPISSFQQQFGADETRENWKIIGIEREKPDASSRINARVKKMVEAGLVEEVRNLLNEPAPLSQQARCAIGYAEIIDHLNGETTIHEATELIKRNTRRLAKGQRTWFRTFKNVNRLKTDSSELPDEILEKAMSILE